MSTWRNKTIETPETYGQSRSKLIQKLVALTVLTVLLVGFNVASAQEQQMMIRISEIQIDPNQLEQYRAILKEEAKESVKLEPGVIAIFPMYQREDDTEFRILEIYANRAAYEAHLKTPHFQKYKTATLRMVKSLKLVDMQTIDAKTMTSMFRKMKGR